MTQKRATKKKGRRKTPPLNAAEIQELDILLDRLRLQSPNGESLDNCLSSLKAALTGRTLLAASLLERLSKEATPVTYQAYLALKDLVVATPYERTLKQADYRFRQRGLASGDPAQRGSSRPSKVVLVQGESKHATAVMFTSTGAAWMASALVPGPFGEPVAITVIIDFAWKIEKLNVADSSSKQYKELLRYVTDTTGGIHFEVPVRHVAGVFFESLDRFPEQKSLPDAARAITLLTPYLETERRPYPYEVFPEAADPAAAIEAVDIAKTMQVLGGDTLSVLLVEKDPLRPYWERIRGVDKSILVVSPEIKQGQTEKILREATDALFAGDAMRLQRRFLEEQALCCRMQKQDDLARDLWLISQHLRTVQAPSESLYLRRLVSGSLYFHWREEFDDQPTEVAREKAKEADGFRRTESGLILL